MVNCVGLYFCASLNFTTGNQPRARNVEHFTDAKDILTESTFRIAVPIEPIKIKDVILNQRFSSHSQSDQR